MKKMSLLLSILLAGGIVFAQKSKISSANSALTSGKLDKAKELIDAALQDKSVATNAKGYFVKAQIYQSIAEDVTGLFSKLDNNAGMIAYEAYKKALEYDTKGKLKKKIRLKMAGIPNALAAMGVKKFETADYKGAHKIFKKILDIKKNELGDTSVDTLMLYNTGLAAEKAEMYGAAADYFKECLSNNYKPDNMYARIASVLKSKGDTLESSKYLQEGFEKFPDSQPLLIELINYYLTGGEPDKAAEYLDKAIEMDPTNASFYRAKGTLYEKTKDYKKAEENYLKAIETDPKDFFARYNLAFLKSGRVAARHKEVNDILDAVTYNAEIKKVFENYKNVIPYFDNALELQEDNTDLLNALKQIYFMLRDEYDGMIDKYNELKAKLEG